MSYVTQHQKLALQICCHRLSLKPMEKEMLNDWRQAHLLVFPKFFFFFPETTDVHPLQNPRRDDKLDNLAELRKGVVILWASTGPAETLPIAVSCINKNIDSSLKNTQEVLREVMIPLIKGMGRNPNVPMVTQT